MKYSGIGGQAVIEGIMMMNRNDYAVAVRRPDGEIEIKKDKYESITTKAKILSLPFIRGVFRFADSMILGMKTLTYSASFFEDDEEEEPGRFEKFSGPRFRRKTGKRYYVNCYGTFFYSGNRDLYDTPTCNSQLFSSHLSHRSM